MLRKSIQTNNYLANSFPLQNNKVLADEGSSTKLIAASTFSSEIFFAFNFFFLAFQFFKEFCRFVSMSIRSSTKKTGPLEIFFTFVNYTSYFGPIFTF